MDVETIYEVYAKSLVEYGHEPPIHDDRIKANIQAWLSETGDWTHVARAVARLFDSHLSGRRIWEVCKVPGNPVQFERALDEECRGNIQPKNRAAKAVLATMLARHEENAPAAVDQRTPEELAEARRDAEHQRKEQERQERERVQARAEQDRQHAKAQQEQIKQRLAEREAYYAERRAKEERARRWARDPRHDPKSPEYVYEEV
ncbi:hypothetical protein LQ327_08825 [Actinomycetospora endophytica]|uniref:Uncharacterized protein n=1 Tax=Actinomycetospora endophytica TaxID=2291215 RepID=A0ABS8P5G1_9PSEU|nr:hypothetical protein [Actinomycetospora endophytica]MCD2193484.1 hypothetical protein [Actinomycetospora endophytica]